MHIHVARTGSTSMSVDYLNSGDLKRLHNSCLFSNGMDGNIMRFPVNISRVQSNRVEPATVNSIFVNVSFSLPRILR